MERNPAGRIVLHDIRELKSDQVAHAEEFERRWTGLLSNRYIDRNHRSMNTGPVGNTVTLRRDLRNAAGGLLVAPISMRAPRGLVKMPENKVEITDSPQVE